MTFFSVWESEFEDTMSHLGAFATEKVPFQVGAVPFDARIVGVWEGNTSKALGGYRQRIEFQNDTWHDFAFCRNEGALFGRELQAQDSSAKTSSAQRMLSQHFQCHFFCDTSTVSHRTSRIFWNLSCQDCINANITVMGQTMDARFRMNCSADPCQLDIEVLPKGSSCHLSKMNSMYLFLSLTRL